jgi:hypothetical protein
LSSISYLKLALPKGKFSIASWYFGMPLPKPFMHGWIPENAEMPKHPPLNTNDGKAVLRRENE